ncbi:MAG TPA: FG-GAP-like repeat-containing protein, partial [Chitinophagales bacterium]|nr:FG-GAP-like repeat-containing protein [Chitinophagales bacterium]
MLPKPKLNSIRSFYTIFFICFSVSSFVGFTQSPTPDLFIESNIALIQYGSAVASAGDINGDGYGDVIVGTKYYTNVETNEGKIEIYLGSAVGISPLPSTVIESNLPNTYYGNSVACAGDINNDGFDDVIVGAYLYDNGQTNEGAVYIYHGSALGLTIVPAIILESNQASAQFGRSVSTAGDINNDGFDDVLIGSDAYTNGQTYEGRTFVYHGSAAGIGITPNATMESNLVNASFGRSVAGLGDVNADGFDDIIVGSPNYTNGHSQEGRAYIYHGTATGINTVPITVMENNKALSYLGFSVSGAGDVNNDGYFDVVLGAYNADNLQDGEGFVYIHYGSASGISATPNIVLESNREAAFFGYSVACAGDRNADGFDDIIIGANEFTNDDVQEGRAFIYYGAALGITDMPNATFESDKSYSNFGAAVSGAGDVNNDGFDDLIIGASDYSDAHSNEGAIYFYLGDNCPTTVFHADSDLDGFGSMISIIVACEMPEGYILDGNDCEDTDALQNPNTVWYLDNDYDNYYAGTGTPITQCERPDWSYFFTGILGGGDCNDSSGVIFPGGFEYLDSMDNDCDGLIEDDYDWTYNALLTHNLLGGKFAHAVSEAGDVNGDGFADIIIGGYSYDNIETDEGAAFIFLGSATGISNTPANILEINQASAYFGYTVSTAGDVNNDGYDDIIVGATLYDNGETDEGRAYIYHGSPTGIIATPAKILECNQISAQFGSCVSDAGDINNDGFDDVIVGAQLYDNGQLDEGVAFVYYGSPIGIKSTPFSLLESNQSVSRFGYAVSKAGDVNNDGYDDVVVGAYLADYGQDEEGAAFVYHGGPTGVNTVYAVKMESNQPYGRFGNSVSNAGDLNNDGYSDLIIGALQYNGIATNVGAAFIYHGSPTGIPSSPTTILAGTQGFAYLGSSVNTLGDVNGDGYSDVIVGAYQYTNGQYDEGATYFYHGTSTGINPIPVLQLESNQSAAWFGYAVSGTGDINNDGFDDAVVGAYLYDTPEAGGAAFVYLSSPCDLNFYADADGDGFGNNDEIIEACTAPPGYVDNNLDCNDANNTINPTQIEICNVLDDNCNGINDEGVIETITIAAAGPTEFCQGGSVSLTATYSGTSLQWQK